MIDDLMVNIRLGTISPCLDVGADLQAGLKSPSRAELCPLAKQGEAK